ncbi:hypothetical protein D3C76_1721470 [compost metagenome]
MAEACQAPNSQPEPMMEPSPVNISDHGLMSRFIVFMESPIVVLVWSTQALGPSPWVNLPRAQAAGAQALWRASTDSALSPSSSA